MDTNDLHEKASELLSEGKLEEAESIYKQILEISPNDESALGALMDIYEDNDHFKYYITRANYNIVNGKNQYAINDCKKALNIEANDVNAREKLARLYRITNQPLKAIDEFSKIIEIDETHISSYIELIDLYTKEDALESAVQIALKANDIFKESSNFNDVVAKLYFDLGDYESALKYVADNGLKVKILLQAGKNNEACNILNSVDLNNNKIPNETIAFYNMLWAQYYYNIDNYDLAFEHIDKYISILGPSPIGYQMKALCYEAKGDSFMAAYNFAYMNKALNKLDDALVEFNNAYTINPKNKDVLIELAKLYELNKEKYTAIDFWQKVYELDEDENARNILVDFYTKEGDMGMVEKFGGASASSLKTQEKYNEPVQEEEGLLDKIMNLFSKK